MLQTNYRNDINVTDSLFPDAEKHLYNFYAVLKEIDGAGLSVSSEDKAFAKKIDDEFNGCMDDDFNTALALGNLFGYFKEMKKYLAEKDGKAAALAAQVRESYGLLGIFKKDANAYVAWYESLTAEAIPEQVKAVAEERWQARLNRDWAKSDELRDRLAELGYAVKDSKTGYELTKNS